MEKLLELKGVTGWRKTICVNSVEQLRYMADNHREMTPVNFCRWTVFVLKIMFLRLVVKVANLFKVK